MNRIVFITGVTSGIGRACAAKFAAAGDHLIINGRRKERLFELQQLLQSKYDIDIFSSAFDVRNREEVFDAINAFPPKWKQIDILINSAGLALGREYFDEASIDDWDTMLDTNVHGLLYVSKAVVPLMISKNKGHIINLGSVAGDEVYERGNVYCASKSAVEAISRAIRIDMLKHGIKVTNVRPGAVETEFSIVRFKGDERQASSVYNGFTPLSGEDVADVIYYCASLPENVCINDIEITPLAQANGIFFYKKANE